MGRVGAFEARIAQFYANGGLLAFALVRPGRCICDPSTFIANLAFEVWSGTNHGNPFFARITDVE